MFHTSAQCGPAFCGALCGGIAGLLAAGFILFHNSVFFDNLGWTLLLLAFPVAGLILGSILRLVRRDESGTGERRKLAGSLIAFSVLYAGFWWWSSYAIDIPLEGDAPDLIVIGLDGATWDIIDPMIEDGELPNLAQLRESGASGPLETLAPIWSPRIWTSLATGREPENHGITGYYKTRADLSAARMWDVAYSEGKSVGLFRWLVTWPPDKRFEFTIPSWLARSPETQPPEYAFIQEFLLDESESPWAQTIHHGVFNGFRISTVVDLLRNASRTPSDPDRLFVHHHFASVAPTVDLYRHLLREYQPEVTCFCLYGTDQLGHRFWKYFQPKEFENVDSEKLRLYRDVIPDYYRLADWVVGEILSILTEQTTIIVISDHGMGPDPATPARYVFRIERILAEIGCGDRFSVSFAQRRYILHPQESTNEKEIASAREQLEEIHLLESEDPVFDVEQEQDGTLILNPAMPLVVSADPPLKTSKGIVIADKTFPIEEMVSIRDLSGSHRSEGICILRGPMIRPRAEIQSAGVLDIAPTALALLGLPLSREMPGRVLKEAIQDEFWESESLRYVDSFPAPPSLDANRPDESIKERLRALGYVQ